MAEHPLSPVEILLVEDNLSDSRLIQEFLGQGAVPHRIHVVPDGVAALDFLHAHGRYAWAPRPDLILLDLDLPRMNGLEVLRYVKRDVQLVDIPVIVLTASAIAEDVLQAYRLQANCYVTKPADLDGFAEMVQAVEAFWLTCVRLPCPEEDRGQAAAPARKRNDKP